jgi:hypothetical protein
VTVFVSWPAISRAAARVIAPNGWGESATAAPDAQRRASQWETDLGLQLAQVVSGRAGDRFAETVAVFERPQPIPAAVFDDEAKAFAELASAVVAIVGDDAPGLAEIRTTATGERIVWARWLVDDLSYECALAPSGNTGSLVISVVRARELAIHQPRLETMFEQLEGVTAPMPRFSLLGWRIGSILIWIVLALGLHAAMLQLGDQDDDHRQAGARASAINLVLILVGTGLTAVAASGRELALIHEGSSVAALSVWVAVVGIVVVGLHYTLTSRLDRGVVQSAPASGAYASGVHSSAELLRTMDRPLEDGAGPDLRRR